MNIPEMQIKYDILLVKLTALPFFLGLFAQIFADSEILSLWLSTLSAIGLVLLMGYLLSVGWFLELCSKDSGGANVINIIAKICQHASIMTSSVVVILLAFT